MKIKLILLVLMLSCNIYGQTNFTNNHIKDTSSIGDVILSKFKGFSRNCINHLKWSLVQELNLESYGIEYSHDGIFFIHLGNIKCKNINYYDFSVLTHNKVNYYRLKFIYIGGDIEYSETIVIESDCSNDEI